MTLAESIACAALHCGVDELKMFNDVKYCLEDLIKEAESTCGKVDINSVLWALIFKGLSDLAAGIEKKISDLDSRITDENMETLKALEKLNPFDDMTYYLNYSDTHVYVVDNEDLYYKYCPELMYEFENNTGLNFE